MTVMAAARLSPRPRLPKPATRAAGQGQQRMGLQGADSAGGAEQAVCTEAESHPSAASGTRPALIHRAAVDFDTPQARAASRTEPPGIFAVVGASPRSDRPSADSALWSVRR